MVSINDDLHRPARETAAVAPLSESVAAIAVIVLAILGLVNVAPGEMLGVVTIVVGAGMLLQGAQTATEYAQLLSTADATVGSAGGEITLKFLAGGVGIVLGILALFSHAQQLAPAALIIFGGAMLLGGGVATRLSLTSTDTLAARPVDMIIRESAAATAGAQVLIGIGAIVLGILALISTQGQTLNLIGLLAVGAALLLTGAASAGAIFGAASARWGVGARRA